MGNPFPTKHHGDVVYVDYIDNRPHGVVTTDGTYDFDAVGGRVMFHESGSGWHENNPHQMLPRWVDPSGTSWWAANCVVMSVWDRDAQATRAATPGEIATCTSRRLADLPGDPFDGADESDSGFAYCTVCEEYYDRDATCRHLFWGDHGLTGPGCSEHLSIGAPGDDCRESFLALCRRAGIVRALRRGLVPFTWEHSESHAVGGLGPSYVWFRSAGKYLGNIVAKLDAPDRFRDGAGWLMALDEKTTAANQQTKRWLDEEVARQDERRASGVPVYIISDGYRYVTEEAGRQVSYWGEHWTAPSEAAAGEAIRMPWAMALERARRLRGDGHEAAIVHSPVAPVRAEVAA